jgi:uncharacterized repeat protein (TIGR01451 family)
MQYRLRVRTSGFLVMLGALVFMASLIFPRTAMTQSTGDLSVSISDGTSSVDACADLLYTIRVRNTAGSVQTQNVTVTLPSSLAVLQAPGASTIESGRIVWRNVRIEVGQEQVFTMTSRVQDRTPDNYVLHVSVSAGAARGSDDTTIRSTDSSERESVSLRLTTDASVVRPGDDLQFEVTIRNTSNRTISVRDLEATIPSHTSVSGISDAGSSAGGRVRWPTFSLRDGEEEIYTYRVRVERGAPQGAELSSTVTALSASARVRASVREGGSATYYPDPYYMGSTLPSYYSDDKGDDKGDKGDKGKGEVFFEKIADKSEVLAGGEIAYRITVRNVLEQPITNVVITDRFDAVHLEVQNAGSAVQMNDDTLRWYMQRLEVGEEWSATYVMSVKKSTKNGTEVINMATITGDGMDELNMSRRVMVIKTGVISRPPPSGAPLDLLFVLSVLPIGVASAFVQRKVRL